MKPYSRTVHELVEAGKDHIPAQMQINTHLIYSSPATLSFHSPGANGFGVKRAGLSVPGSVMLLVSPACCARNTGAAAAPAAYRDRYYFLLMDESDIVTGRHLRKIPQAVCEIVDDLDPKPSVVMICSTCVDALLGTDWDRVCRKAEEAAHVPVRPCYMYALTREGRKPPMTLVRTTIYSLLQPAEKDPRSVNLLGYFSPLCDDSDLYDILHQIGLRRIREISRCRTFDEYLKMAEANFNLVLDPQARDAAEDMNRRLGIPYIELTRLYQIEKIHRQYQIFAKSLGAAADDTKAMEKAQDTVRRFADRFGHVCVSVGEMVNANPFELSLALAQYGCRISEIFASVTPEDYVYLRHLDALCPDAAVYSNLSPTMLYYNCASKKADLTIGEDAGYYHPDCPNVPFHEEKQPFGYTGVTDLIGQMSTALEQYHL